jgi:hypothetical protein
MLLETIIANLELRNTFLIYVYSPRHNILITGIAAHLGDSIEYLVLVKSVLLKKLGLKFFLYFYSGNSGRLG